MDYRSLASPAVTACTQEHEQIATDVAPACQAVSGKTALAHFLVLNNTDCLTPPQAISANPLALFTSPRPGITKGPARRHGRGPGKKGYVSRVPAGQELTSKTGAHRRDRSSLAKPASTRSRTAAKRSGVPCPYRCAQKLSASRYFELFVPLRPKNSLICGPATWIMITMIRITPLIVS